MGLSLKSIGSFGGAGSGGGGLDRIYSSVMGGLKAEEKGYKDASGIYRQMYDEGRSDLAPYSSFGNEFGLNALKGVGKFSAPTMDDVYASPDYNLGLKTIENSAAARGGLMSGNFLRSAQDYAGSIYNREYARKQSAYQQELARLMGYTNIGYGAAGGSAGLTSQAGNALAGLRVGEGSARTNRTQYLVDLASKAAGSIAGGAG